MAPDKPSRDKELGRKMVESVGAREKRKVRARRRPERSAWFGLGMFGLVGWSVAVPTVLGVALGVWIDSTVGDQYSWTLMLLFIGVAVGCFNAWFWVRRESDMDGDDS